MANRKITINFDEESLAKWKAATDKMSALQLNAYTKIVLEQQRMTLRAANEIQQATIQSETKKAQAQAAASAKEAVAAQAASAKKVAAEEAASAKRTAAIERTAQADLAAEAKIVAAKEAAVAKKTAAEEKSAQVEMQMNAKLITERQKSIDKKIELWEKEDTKRRAIDAKTEQTSINANAKIEAAAQKGTNATKAQTNAQRELNTEASKTSGIFDSITARFTAANLISSAFTFAISRLRTALREAVSDLKEMDKELTTIKMVTGASDYDISKLTEQAFAGARANGRNVNDYLTAAERFARAGYRDNIDQLSKLSLMTQNIGGVEEETAAKFLLAADAAWKLNGSYDALMGVLDGVSSVADQNATDLGKIAEGITVAGSAFANAGESAQTFTAMLGVTTASTQRSGSEMARGLRMILFRVRQVKAEFEDGEIVDDKAISNAAKALSDVGISVLDETGDLKSLSQVLEELSKKWGSLSKAQQSYLQNYLAGNRNGNVLYALMDNWGAYEKMLQQYEDSGGTALEKNAKYTESWAAATADLKTAWMDFMGTMTANGGALQWITERLTELIDKSNAFVQETREAWDFSGLEWDSNAKRFKRVEKDVEDSGKAAKEAAPEIVDYSNAVDEAGENADDASDDVKKLTTAFDKQREKISEVAKAIKEEKNDAVNSLADIYKAAMEAADKGYYGSNAYRQGGALFFSSGNLDELEREGKLSAREYLDAYFKEIESGDYSNAAANFFGKITGGSYEIKDKNKQTIASMKDLGDSFEWTFDKGSLSMDEYLQSLASSTGISETFWASMIESLGMYSEELAAWTEANGEIKSKVEVDTEEAEENLDTVQEKRDNLKDKEITISADTEDAQSNIGAVQAARDALSDKTITITTNVVQSGSYNKPFSENDDSWIVSEHTVGGKKANKVYVKHKTSTGSTASDLGLITDTFGSEAGGKRDNYSGIALVNDEYPANGSTPELIISKSSGTAYIANGGKPALVNLASDDIVLTASETKSAFGVPGFAVGKDIQNAFNRGEVLSTKVTTKTPKNSTKKSGSSSSSATSADATDTWNQLKKLIDYMVEEQKGILDQNLKVLDKQLEELEATRKAQKDEDELTEKQLKVDEALLDLQKAQNERTVRYYNESTHQWEWMADQGVLAQAEEAYSDALKELKDFLSDLDFNEQKAAIQAQKDALQEAFDAYKEGWDLIVKSIEKPTGDLAALFEELKTNGTEAMQSQADNISALLDALELGFFYGIGDVTGNANSGIGDVTTAASSGIGDVTGAASSGITDVVSRANAFLESVKQAENNAKAAETAKATTSSSSGGGGGSGGGGSGGGTGSTQKTVLGTTNGNSLAKSVSNLASTITTAAVNVASKAVGNVVYKATNNTSTVNNNNGNTININGIKFSSDILNKPMGTVLSTLSLHANSTR